MTQNAALGGEDEEDTIVDVLRENAAAVCNDSEVAFTDYVERIRRVLYSIRELNLIHYHIGSNGVRLLVDALVPPPAAKETSPSDVAILAVSLPLESLYASHNSLTLTEIAALFPSISPSGLNGACVSSLKHLDLSFNSLCANHKVNWSSVAFPGTLQHLNLSSCDLTAVDMHFLCTTPMLLRRLTWLEQLSISHNSLGSDGLSHLITLLTGKEGNRMEEASPPACPKLNLLQLAYNAIGCDVSRALLHALNTWKGTRMVQEVRLHGNPVIQPGNDVFDLHEALCNAGWLPRELELLGRGCYYHAGTSLESKTLGTIGTAKKKMEEDERNMKERVQMLEASCALLWEEVRALRQEVATLQSHKTP